MKTIEELKEMVNFYKGRLSKRAKPRWMIYQEWLDERIELDKIMKLPVSAGWNTRA